MLRCEEPPVVAVAASPAFLSLSEPTGALTSWVPQFLWPHLLPISKTGSLPASPLPPPDLICHLPEAAALSSQMHKAEETGPEQEPPGDPAGGHPLPDRDRGPDRPGPSCRERVGLVGRPEVTTASQEKPNKAVSMEWGGDPVEAPGGVPVPQKEEGQPLPMSRPCSTASFKPHTRPARSHFTGGKLKPSGVAAEPG